MIKKINKYFNLSIITSIIFMLLGIVVLLFPKTTLNIFYYCIAVMAIVIGFSLVIIDIRTKNMFFSLDSSLFGILLLILGIIILVHPEALATLIPIGLGIWFITSSVMKFRFTSLLRGINTGVWLSIFLMTLLSIICGLIFIINPLGTSTFVTSGIGLLIIIYSISDIVEMIILKMNANKINKSIKDSFKIIDELK